MSENVEPQESTEELATTALIEMLTGDHHESAVIAILKVQELRDLLKEVTLSPTPEAGAEGNADPIPGATKKVLLHCGECACWRRLREAGLSAERIAIGECMVKRQERYQADTCRYPDIAAAILAERGAFSWLRGEFLQKCEFVKEGK